MAPQVASCAQIRSHSETSVCAVFPPPPPPPLEQLAAAKAAKEKNATPASVADRTLVEAVRIAGVYRVSAGRAMGRRWSCRGLSVRARRATRAQVRGVLPLPRLARWPAASRSARTTSRRTAASRAAAPRASRAGASPSRAAPRRRIARRTRGAGGAASRASFFGRARSSRRRRSRCARSARARYRPATAPYWMACAMPSPVAMSIPAASPTRSTRGTLIGSPGSKPCSAKGLRL